MALSGSLLASDLQVVLAPWSGSQLSTFCLALGNGIVDGTKGILTFTTQDAGAPGSGAGAGVGIKGMSPLSMSAKIYSHGQLLWSPSQRDGPGVEWQSFCDKLAATVVVHFKTFATLSSGGSVLAGTGVVKSYGGVTVPVMKAAIVAGSPGWPARWAELAEAVAEGVVGELLSHTPSDQVVISPGQSTLSGSSGIVT